MNTCVESSYNLNIEVYQKINLFEKRCKIQHNSLENCAYNKKVVPIFSFQIVYIFN